MKILVIVMAAALAAVGCDDSKGTGNTPAAGADAEGADLPVPADFEEDAEKSITSSNYKDELGALEKEIDAP